MEGPAAQPHKRRFIHTIIGLSQICQFLTLWGSVSMVRAALTGLVEPLTETLEPRGESGLIVRRYALFLSPARAVGHLDTREVEEIPSFSPPLKPRGPY